MNLVVGLSLFFNLWSFFDVGSRVLMIDLLILNVKILVRVLVMFLRMLCGLVF